MSERVKQEVLRKARDPTREKHKRRGVWACERDPCGQASRSKTNRKDPEGRWAQLLPTAQRLWRSSRTTSALRRRWAAKWARKPATFWRHFLCSDEKIFKTIPKMHAKNDGLWLSAEDPTQEELDQVTVVQDRNCSSVCFWGGGLVPRQGAVPRLHRHP